MTKIILLGGTGFIGTPLLEKLLQENYNVKALIHKNNSEKKLDFFYGDILEPHLLDNIIDDGDIVVNLIGQIDDDSKFIDENILGGMNLLNSCIKKRQIKLILASSISVYGDNFEKISKENDPPNPLTTYGQVKSITEKIYKHYAENFGLDVTVLRFATLYGPKKKSGFIVKLIKSLKNDQTKQVFNNGKQIRDMLFVDDAVDGILCAIKQPQQGFKIFNISSGKKYTISEIITIIEKLGNKKLLVKYNSKIPDEQCLCADNSKSLEILNFSPKIDIETGMKITIDYFFKKND